MPVTSDNFPQNIFGQYNILNRYNNMAGLNWGRGLQLAPTFPVCFKLKPPPVNLGPSVRCGWIGGAPACAKALSRSLQ